MRSQARPSARETAFRELRRRIITSQMPPGTPIAEKDLAAELGTSRTPVREALMLLSEEGLVQVFPQLSTFVTRISVARVRQSQFIREALESASLREAVLQVDGDAFHRRLVEVAGRDDVWPDVSSAKTHMDRARRLSLPLPDVLERLHTEHVAIADGLRRGDEASGLDSLRSTCAWSSRTSPRSAPTTPSPSRRRATTAPCAP